MLSELSIENFAIIDRLLLRFESGFTVLTGETGAGKSIIIDALQAALGARIPSDVVRADARLAAVEAVFDLAAGADADSLAELLADVGIEDDGCLILRREIASSGRSTARLNGRAVPVSTLAAVAARLVDIHGQSDHLSILRRDRQLDVLDRFGGLYSLRTSVADAVRYYMGLRAELEELEGGRREAEQRLDLLRFQVQEIEGARLDPGEEASLEVERNLLANAERLTHLSGVAYEALQGSADSVVDALAAASSAVGDLAEIDPALGPLRDRLTSARYEVEDVSQDLRQYRDGVEYDPARLNEIEERVDLLSRLKRKYGTTLADVISFGGEARAEMEAVENLDERLEDLRRRLDEGAEQTAAVVWDLSKQRIATAGALEAAMSSALQGLGLKGTSFHVRLEQSERADGLQVPDGRRLAVSTSGIDSVTFEVSFNPGEPIRPLDRVASGGETSRFLLALKSVLAEADETPTLIFDEVDVGVGGRRAADVGERMRQLAGHHQVISITHMPQIAAMADQHLTVSKRVTAGRTTVDVRGLDRADRIAEIAEMMTGTGSEVARQNARELLEAAHRGE